VGVVCVIGMHRSGTSVVTRMLNLLGVSLGPEEELVPSSRLNPAGFWENERIVELDDELLAALGGDAWSPPVLADGWEQATELDGLRARAASLVGSLTEGTEIVGWKDPRLSLTLPFWRTVTPITHVVHCLRDPSEAAPSFARWHPLDIEDAGELWLRCVVSACRAAPEQLLVVYDDVLAEPAAVARRLATALGLPDPAAETLAEVEGTVDPELHRFRRPAETPNGALALPGLLYRLLVEDGPTAARPLIDLLHRSWLGQAGLRRACDAADELQQGLLETRAILEALVADRDASRGAAAARAEPEPAAPLLRRLLRG